MGGDNDSPSTINNSDIKVELASEQKTPETEPQNSGIVEENTAPETVKAEADGGEGLKQGSPEKNAPKNESQSPSKENPKP